MKQIKHNWKRTIAIGFALRVILILCLSFYEDVYWQKMYFTDIDYKVFSDSTLYPSPYDRHTYRYTPLISYLMSFNYTLHQSIGKIIFALFDVIAMVYLYLTVSRHNNDKFRRTSYTNGELVTKAYAYNPLFIALTVRGSCQSISLALMYSFWYYCYGGEASGNLNPNQICLNRIQNTQPESWKKYLSYAIYGLWVHVRVYPIIFLPLIIMHQYFTDRNRNIKVLFTKIISMALVAGGVFLLLAALFYCLYGQKFIDQAYLYHLYRKDNRHSFSALFYEMYLNWQPESNGITRSLMRVLPFTYILLSLSFRNVRNYSPFYLQFLLTFAFVTFNKVITMQYYMWIFGSVLLVMSESLIFTQKNYKKAFNLGIQFVLGVAVWVWSSMRLEDSGQNIFHTIWLVCLFKMFLDIWVLVNFMKTIRELNPEEVKRMKIEEAKSILSGRKVD